MRNLVDVSHTACAYIGDSKNLEDVGVPPKLEWERRGWPPEVWQ